MKNEMITTAPAEGHRGDHRLVRVVVSYMAAVRPYKAEVAENETLGALKITVLDKFGLKETGNKVFKLFHNGTELTNPSETVGQVAGRHEELHLKLEEIIIQG
jgi:hypothetical protein